VVHKLTNDEESRTLNDDHAAGVKHTYRVTVAILCPDAHLRAVATGATSKNTERRTSTSRQRYKQKNP